jgi:hypothetical protein
MTAQLMVLSPEQFNKASKLMIEATETINDQAATIEAHTATINTMKTFLFQYLDTMEGIFDSDESQLSTEHLIEYVEAAKYAADRFGRINNRIRQMEEVINKLPY